MLPKNQVDKSAIIQEIFRLFHENGHSEYGGEDVNQLEHALQAATFARNSGATDTLVTAALLHDVGHLLHDLPDDAPSKGIDDLHENKAFDYLISFFPPAVTEPVRLHVAAKRYLSTKEPQYLEQLSEPSLQSLELQGGLMSETELENFEKSPYFKDALQVRRWDDQAKIKDFVTPPLADFEKELLNSL